MCEQEVPGTEKEAAVMRARPEGAASPGGNLVSGVVGVWERPRQGWRPCDSTKFPAGNLLVQQVRMPAVRVVCLIRHAHNCLRGRLLRRVTRQ